MIFRMGRVDIEEKELSSENLLPSTIHENDTILNKMLRNGFTKQEVVALMGQYTLGFARMDRTGFQSRWTQNPHVFDNEYFKEVLLGERSKYLKTQAEH